MSRNSKNTPGSAKESDATYYLKIFLGLLVISSFVMVTIGAVWMYYVFGNYPNCGISYTSASFSVYTDGDYRILTGNSCPGYDWTTESTPHSPGQLDFTYAMPVNPVNCTTPLDMTDSSNPVYLRIGYALNGVEIFSPLDDEGRDALEYEHSTFDHVGSDEKSLLSSSSSALLLAFISPSSSDIQLQSPDACSHCCSAEDTHKATMTPK